MICLHASVGRFALSHANIVCNNDGGRQGAGEDVRGGVHIPGTMMSRNILGSGTSLQLLC